MKNRRFELRNSACAALLAISLAAVRGAAQPIPSSAPGAAASSGDSVLDDARAAFREGSSLARISRWEEALIAFERSYELHAHPVTSYNIAYCERAMGHYTRAYAAFARALREHTAGSDGTLSESLLSALAKYRNEIEQRLARVRITLRPPDTRVLVDGRPLETAIDSSGRSVMFAGTRDVGAAERVPVASFELWLDPGPHVFVLSLGPAMDRIVTARYAPGARAALELTVPPKLVRQSGRSAPVAEPRASAGTHGTWTYVALGAGALGVLTGSVAGALALHARSELTDACGTDRADCLPNQQKNIDAMKRFADISTIAFAAGTLGLATGIVLWAFDSKGRPTESRVARYRVLVEPAGARFQARF